MHFSTGRGIIKTLAIFSCHRGVCITPLCSPTQFKGIDLQFTGLCLIKVNIEKTSLWSANLIKARWNLSTPSGLRGAVIPEQQSSQSQSQSSGMCWGFFSQTASSSACCSNWQQRYSWVSVDELGFYALSSFFSHFFWVCFSTHLPKVKNAAPGSVWSVCEC